MDQLDIKNKSRLKWTSEEDQFLKDIKQNQKIQSWTSIASCINSFFNEQRTPKQCRERYINSARFFGFEEEKNKWTLSDERLIFELYMKLGSQWSLFVKQLEGRSQNDIKNKFYNLLRKTLRELNQATEKSRDHLKIDSILIILDLSKKIENQSETLLGYKLDSSQIRVLEIRNRIIEATVGTTEFTSEDLHSIVQHIHQTNRYLRHMGIYKSKTSSRWSLNKNRLQHIIEMQSTLPPLTRPCSSVPSESSLSPSPSSSSLSSFNCDPIACENILGYSSNQQIFMESCMQSPCADESTENWRNKFNLLMWE